MRTRNALFATILALGAGGAAHAIGLEATQVGGFAADGGKANDPAFQNYFVGYGTTPGFARTAERRSFFVFDLPALPAGSSVAAATLEIRLPFGGLIFGKGPGDPGPSVPSDAFEVFALTLPLGLDKALVLSPGLSPPEVMALFATIAVAPAAADAYVFGLGAPLPPDPDGKGAVISLGLTGAALAKINASLGSDLVLTGWMPSWSEDLRPKPGDPGAFFEASELIFGLTDVHAGVPKPVLMLTVVPEPASALLFGAGLVGLAGVRVGARGATAARPSLER
jgi:hypothetical protein